MSDLSEQEVDVLTRVHRAVSTVPGDPLVVVGGWAARLKEANDFELEFIAPLRGGDVRRDGTPDVTADVLGVSAQKLRHVELLLLEPCPIEFPELASGATLLVANPASFILQRLLVLPSRPSLLKKGKDALYIHDALQLFTHKGRIHPDIVPQAARVLATLSKKQLQHLRETVAILGDTTAGPVKEAARIAAETPRPSPPSATAIGVACRLGLAELLG